MRRVFAILGSIFFLLIAPGTVAGVIPWDISHWRMQPPLLGLSLLRAVGVLFIAVGIPMLLDSFGSRCAGWGRRRRCFARSIWW